MIWEPSEELTYPTPVGPAPPYQCPAGKTTDASVWILAWSAPQIVSGKPPGGAHDQFQEWVAAGPRDHVDVVFYHRRLDPANRRADTFVARSMDGGRTFRQIKVSSFASDFDNALALFGGAGSIRDYLGMVMDRFGTSYPAWTGAKPGKLDSDIFMATVEGGR